jgi:prophage regulatory protein
MSEAANRRLLRLPEVKEKVGLSRTAIYRLIAEGQFPRQVCIGPRTVAWCQEELEAWIEQRIQGAVSEPAASWRHPKLSHPRRCQSRQLNNLQTIPACTR